MTDGDGGQNTTDIAINLLNQLSISGAVFVDKDQNGRFDAKEAGIDGAIIELLDERGTPVLDARGGPRTTTTAHGGRFVFEDLPRGIYRLHEIQPAGWTDGPQRLGSLAGSIPANDMLQLQFERLDACDYYFAALASRLLQGNDIALNELGGLKSTKNG